MTLPKLAKDLLMFLVSVSLAPSEPESLSRSDPAKSTRFKVPEQLSVVTSLLPTIFNWNTECDLEGREEKKPVYRNQKLWPRPSSHLEDRSLQLVAATARFFFARCNNFSICLALVTSSIFKFVTKLETVSPSLLNLMSYFNPFSVASRSRISSL